MPGVGLVHLQVVREAAHLAYSGHLLWPRIVMVDFVPGIGLGHPCLVFQAAHQGCRWLEHCPVPLAMLALGIGPLGD